MASERLFDVREHSNDILSILNKMREESSFCDVYLEVENKSFPAHRVVLSAASDYFNKMFNIDMKEKHQKTIRIKEVSHETMQAVLNFIYTGDVTLTENNVSSVLKAASLMQVSDLLKVVGEYLSEVLNISNCLHFRKLGVMHLLNGLVDQANRFILENFEKISSQELFYDLDAEEIESLLKSDELVVEEEKIVFETIIKWVNTDSPNRKQHFPSLFKRIRLQFVPIKFVAGTIRKDNLVREFLDCRDLVEDVFFFHISPEMVVAETHRISYKKAEPLSIMVFNAANNYQNVFDVGNKSWTQIANTGWTNNLVLLDCAVATKPSSYMFCGGRNNSNQVSNAVVQFNGQNWKQFASMTKARCGGAAVYHRHTLYVFGGEKTWTNPSLRYNNYNNQINMSMFVQSFEVLEDDWKVQGNMRSVRSYARAECFGNKIYLFGGFTLNKESQMQYNTLRTRRDFQNKLRLRVQYNSQNEYCKIPCSSTDVYDTQNNKWSDGPQLNVARADFASATLDSTIYVLGGTGVNNSNLLDVEFMRLGAVEKVWTRINVNSPYSLKKPSACCIKDQIYLKSLENNYLICFNPFLQNWSLPDPHNNSVYGNLVIPV